MFRAHRLRIFADLRRLLPKLKLSAAKALIGLRLRQVASLVSFAPFNDLAAQPTSNAQAEQQEQPRLEDSVVA